VRKVCGSERWLSHVASWEESVSSSGEGKSPTIDGTMSVPPANLTLRTIVCLDHPSVVQRDLVLSSYIQAGKPLVRSSSSTRTANSALLIPPHVIRICRPRAVRGRLATK